MGQYLQSGSALLVLAVSILRQFLPSAPLNLLCAASFLLMLLISAAQGIRLARIVLALIAVSISASYLMSLNFMQVTTASILQGSDFAALFTALALLREPASQSDIVRVAGANIVLQPSTRRAVLLSIGTHAIAVVLHVGTLTMLGLMVKRGVSTALHWPAQFRESELTRCMLAILRGSSSTTCWAPTSATIPLLLSTVPGASFGRIFAIGAVAALTLVALAWLFDALGYRRTVDISHQPINLPALAKLALLVSAIIAGVVATSFLGSFDIPHSVMIALPPICLFWIALQIVCSQNRMISGKLHVDGVMRGSIPSSMREIVLLGGVAFLAKAVISADLAHFLIPAVELLPIPQFIVPILIFVTILAASRLGLPPIVSLVILASALGDIRQYGVPLEPVILAYILAMALGTQICPATANALILSNILGTRPQSFIRNNELYVGCAALAGMIAIAIATSM